MEFDWTEEQRALYTSVRELALTAFVCSSDGLQTDGQFARDWETAARAGLPGLSISREFGGRGFSCLSTALALEALGNGCRDGGFAFAVAAHLLACALPIDRHGTSEQKARYLPGLCSGRTIGANGISETDAGSDVAALATQAEARGNGYVLNGAKTWVTNAPMADLFLVYACTTPGRGPFSTSAFLVERQTPGLTVEPAIKKMGLSTAHMATVQLVDCYTPRVQRLGHEGAGAAIFQDSMGWERSCLFALWIGAMDRQLDQVVAHANTRRQYGRSIGTNQAVSHRIVDMKLRLEAARLLLYRACWERDRHGASDLWASLAKVAVSEAFLESSLDAVQIFGARGITCEAGIEAYVRDAVPGTIYSGSSEIQREVIARALGLPAAPWKNSSWLSASKTSY
jgi:alkylation response protein AidB-like acyl-CoA dehydrogenase